MAESIDTQPFSSKSRTKTPVSLCSNKCETCGKSFEHSSSYRRHTRTHCSSQSRKRRRQLWIPEELDGEDAGVNPLLNTFDFETEGRCPWL